MPRTQNATTALIVCLAVISLTTVFQTWQNNSTEQKVIERNREIKNLTLAQQKYLYSQHPQLRAQAEKDKAEAARKAEQKKAEKAKGGN